MKKSLIVILGSLLFANLTLAEDLKQIFGNVEQYVTKKNYSKALEELGWAKKEIEKMHTTFLQSFLPDELVGFAGQKFEANSMLGISSVERTYKKSGANGTVKVSITGGSSGSGAGGFGSLAALGSMAAMMGGNQPGSETFRINGRTANLTNEGSSGGELTVFLESGSILKFEGNRGTDGETLKAMANTIKLNDLDNYLKGVS